MSNTQANCDKFDKTFTLTLKENTKAAAYMLGNLYYYLPKQKGEEKKLIEDSIKKAKEEMSKKQITGLWDEFSNLSKEDWQTLAKGNRKSLYALRKNMLRESDYFQHIDNKQLIKLGQDLDFTREVHIALVRKELLKSKHLDPFKRDKFDYDLLKTGSSEENHPYLYPFFNKCQTVPIDEIGQLGEKNLKVAETILKDLSTTPHYFTVSAKLAEFHQKLRPSIAKDWNKVTATHPLTPEQQKSVPETLNKLKSEYCEFKEVKINTRSERVQPRGENEAPFPTWQHVSSGAVGGTIGFGGTALVITAACPPLLPLFVMSGVGAAGGYVLSKSETVNNWERKARRKLRGWFGWN